MKNGGRLNKRRKKGGERVEAARDKRSKERRGQKKSNGRKKVFWVWRFRPYGQSLQKCGKGGTDDGVLK